MNINDTITNVEMHPTDFSRLASTYRPNPNAKVLDLISGNDPHLLMESAPYITGEYKDELNQLILDLTETMRYHGGIGISAIQCGIPLNLFLVEMGSETPHVFINAKIVDTTEASSEMEEGCLSYPGIVVKLTRPNAIRIRYTDQTGETKTEKYGGMTARIIQHEMDHILGKTIKTETSRLKWELALKRKKKNR